MSTSPAAGLLARQLKQMQTDKDIPGISCGLADNNIFEWEVMLMISDDCKFYGGMNQPWSPNAALTYFHRWLFPCPFVLSARISTPATQDEV
jgi:hypothetical protein